VDAVERRLHRARGDFERLEEEGAEGHGDAEGDDERLDELAHPGRAAWRRVPRQDGPPGVQGGDEIVLGA
jgi:hypothetical protein